MIPRIAVVVLLVGMAATACAPRHRLSATTGPARLVRTSSIVLPLMTWEDYRSIADIRSAHPSFVTLVNDRTDFDEHTRFTILPLAGRSITLAMTWDEGSARVFRVDLDGDGDLLNDPAYQVEERDGRHALELTTRRTIVRDEGTVEGPLHFRLVEAGGHEQGHGHDHGGSEASLLFEHSTIRRGTIQVGTREFDFGLLGEFGEYDQGHHMLLIDRNGDGRLELDDPQSLERVPLSESYVNLGGRSFAFSVDPRGDRLDLERLQRKIPDRAIIGEGRPAPDFVFDDFDGRTRRLSDYRGRVVLLAFWATWCKPCVKEAPELVEILETYRDRGFEILGIHASGEEETVRQFLADHGIGWPQTIQESDGDLMRLYRVRGYPTNMLIDRDGTIVSPNVHPRKLRTYLESLLSKPAG